MYVVQPLSTMWRLYQIKGVRNEGKLRAKLIYKNLETDWLTEGGIYDLREKNIQPYWLQIGDIGLFRKVETHKFVVTGIELGLAKSDPVGYVKVKYQYLESGNCTSNDAEFIMSYMEITDGI